MGFRAPYLLGTARVLGAAKSILRLSALRLGRRTELLKLPGVGRKIADCVLLVMVSKKAFRGVWVMKALRQLYFRKRRITAGPGLPARHFGPHADYAQQYPFTCGRNKPQICRKTYRDQKQW
jgi:N-glycosylase/DNA lyase